MGACVAGHKGFPMKDLEQKQPRNKAIAKLRVRPACEGDAAEIARMVRALAAFNKDVSKVTAAQVLDAGFGSARWAQIYVAERDGGLLGYGALTLAGQLQFCRRIADVHHLYVAPVARGQAVGRKLMDALRDAALSQGAEVLTIGTTASNWRARTAYLKMGFTQVPRSGVKLAMALS